MSNSKAFPARTRCVLFLPSWLFRSSLPSASHSLSLTCFFFQLAHLYGQPSIQEEANKLRAELKRVARVDESWTKEHDRELVELASHMFSVIRSAFFVLLD